MRESKQFRAKRPSAESEMLIELLNKFSEQKNVNDGKEENKEMKRFQPNWMCLFCILLLVPYLFQL